MGMPVKCDRNSYAPRNSGMINDCINVDAQVDCTVCLILDYVIRAKAF